MTAEMRPASGDPSSWAKRGRLMVLAFAGFVVACYLALYQVGVFSEVWDPFFPEGSPKVLHLLDLVPDAAAGALAYLTEIALLSVGGRERWRAAPWIPLALGAVIISGALVSVALVLIQPLVAGAWCTLCLTSAAISFAIFGLGLDEPRAALRHLRRARDSEESVWRALWGTFGKGG